MINQLKLLLITATLILFTNNIIFSQDTGLIQGVVKDLTKGKNLPLAQVFIEGESLGDVADSNGTFEIINIPEGTYTIIATMIGYETAKIKNVTVNAGNITSVSFELKQKIIELDEEVMVYATKIPKSIKNISGTAYMVDKKEIKQTECRNIEEVLTKIPGAFTEDRFHGESNIVSFRGVGLHTHITRGILVLVDRISINATMGRTSFESSDFERVQRIEVSRVSV